MTIDVDTLSELYTVMKQYIPKKDQQEAADALISTMVDMLEDHELSVFGATDGMLKRAIKEYIGEDEQEDDDEEDY